MFSDADDILYDDYQKLRREIVEVLVGEYNYESDREIIELTKEFNERNEHFKKRLKDELINDKNNEIYELKVQLGKEKSEWIQRGNSYSRWNPNGLKFESCILPLDFNINEIEITRIDEISGKMYFKDPKNIEKSKNDQYWIYIELYDFLKSKPRVLEQKDVENFKIDSIKTWEDMQDYIFSKGISPKGYMKKLGIFLLELKGETFTTDDIDNAIVFNHRKNRRAYVQKFIDLGLVEDTKIIGTGRKKF